MSTPQAAAPSGRIFRDRNDAGSAPAPSGTLVSQIKTRMPIVDVIGRHIALKPVSGNSEMVGMCCFHEDDTPSLYVSAEQGTYYCHGCQASGNVIHFTAHMTGVDYDAAKKAIGRDLGLLYDRPQDSRVQLLEASVDRYRSGLGRSGVAQDYLIERGVSVASADKFGIGYCWGDEFARGTPETIETAAKAGLYSQRSGRSFLGGRLTFPIRAQDGRVIAFAGRVIERKGAVVDPAKKPPPKYLNTPETDLFNKSEVLYGMFEARAGIARARSAIVVEGYMDVIALHQHGAENAVGVMGASANERAFEALWAVTDRIVFCLDGDAAGRAGTLRSVASAAPPMKDGQSISVAFLPDGQDPDEFVLEHGIGAFEALIEAAQPLSRYLVEQSRVRFNLDVAEQRAAFMDEMTNAAAMFPGAPSLKAEIERQAQAECAAHVVRAALSGVGVTLVAAEIESAIAALQQLSSVSAPVIKGANRIYERVSGGGSTPREVGAAEVRPTAEALESTVISAPTAIQAVPGAKPRIAGRPVRRALFRA